MTAYGDATKTVADTAPADGGAAGADGDTPSAEGDSATDNGDTSTTEGDTSLAGDDTATISGDTSTTEVDTSSAEDDTTTSDDARPRVLFIDNYDSFTYNLVDYVSAHAETEVLLNDASLTAVREVDPDAIVISPGPGTPENDRDVGVTNDVLTEISRDVPTLGVCLGLEAAVYAYGGSIGRAPEPIHGKASPIDHDGTGVFAGLDQGFRGGRYHSLVAESVPACFGITATTDHEGTEIVMGVRHREHPIECVQFHPESVLTAAGHDVIRNFLDLVTQRRTA